MREIKRCVTLAVGVILLCGSISWSARTSDKTPLKKQEPAQTYQTPVNQTAYFESLVKKQRGVWVSWEEKKRLNKLLIQQERQLGSSAWQAASGIQELPFFQAGPLHNETAPEIYDAAASTFFDLNGHGRNPRQIAVTGGFPSRNETYNVAVTWSQTSYPYNPGAQAERFAIAKRYLGASNAPGDIVFRVLNHAQDFGGYESATYTPLTDRFVFSYDNIAGSLGGILDGTAMCVEKNAGDFDWDDEFFIPNFSGVETYDPTFWPVAAGGWMIDTPDYDGDGSNTDTAEVLHFTGLDNESGPSFYKYARCVDSTGIWIWPGFNPAADTPGSHNNVAMVIDSGLWFTPTVVTSKKSPKVALIWGMEKDCNYQYPCMDLYYIESTNGGEDWITSGFPAPIPITNLDPDATTRPNGDVMGVYDSRDSSIISWVQWTDYDPLTGDNLPTTDFYVWTKEFGVRKAISGDFPIETINFKNQKNHIPGAGYHGTISYPHISVYDTGAPGDQDGSGEEGNLYMTYMQYAGNDAASLADTSSNGLYNGEVYISVSTNHGKTWSQGLNITYSKTPACPVPVNNNGACAGVQWSSAAEWVNDTIHILFLSDEYAGSMQFGENTEGPSGTTTRNEVLYMKWPVLHIDGSRQISVTTTSFTLNPDGVLTETLFVQNIGNMELTIDSIRHKATATWLSFPDPSDTAGFTIPEGDPDRVVEFTVNDASLSDGVYYDTITVYSNAANAPVLKIPVFLIVDNTGEFWMTVQRDTMDNGVVAIEVSNVSNIANEGMGFYRITGGGTLVDTTNNLFDASKFIAFVSSSGDSTAFRYVFYEPYMAPFDTLFCTDTVLSSALPSKPGSKVKIPAGGYKYCRASYTGFMPGLNGIEWPGPWSGIEIMEEWWLPDTVGPSKPNTFAWDPKLLLWGQTIHFNAFRPPWWANNPAFNPATCTLYFGKVMDWDVFSEDGSENWGWANRSVGTAWQQGEDDTVNATTDPNGHIGFVSFLDSLGNHSAFAAHIVGNAAYIYPQSGYDSKQLYQIAIDQSISNSPTVMFVDSSINFKYVPEDTVGGMTAAFLPTDLNIVLTDLRVTPPYPDSITVYNVLGVLGDTGHIAFKSCDSLVKVINGVRSVLGIGNISGLMDSLNCALIGDDGRAGDVNGDGPITLADVIHLVNYVYDKDRAATGCLGSSPGNCWIPDPVCRGEINGTSPIGLPDVIHLVNYIFDKDRPATSCLGSSPGNCWWIVPTGTCLPFVIE